jgi:CheY-like chemotaxis protein
MINTGAEFDLLFSDVIMTGKMTGYDLAEAVRSRLPMTKVLFSSGYTALGAPEVPDGSPATPLISKPYPKEELALAVRDALDGGRAPPQQHA